MSAREVTGVRRDARGRTVALTNPAAPWSPVAAGHAARQIAAGLYRYISVSGNSSADIKVVNGPHGPYLRSSADGQHPDNLDAMPDAEPQHPLTGGFDVALEFDESTLGLALEAMHSSGAIGHRASVVAGDDIAVLSLGSPQLRLRSSSSPPASCVVRTPYLAWVRPRHSGDDAGYTASGVVEAPVSCYSLVEADGSITVATDWSAVAESDIAVAGAAPAVAARVRAAVIAWASEAGGRYPTPSVESLGSPVGVGLRFVAASQAVAAQVGMDLVLPLGGGWPTPTGESLRVALAGTWVIPRVMEGLRNHFGALPEPYGQTHVAVGNGIGLIALDAELSDRGVVFTGRLSAGLILATFSATVRMAGRTAGSVAASGIEGVGGSGVDFDGVSVDVTDMLGRIADFFSAGALRQALTAGIRKAIASADGGLAELLSRTTVRATAAVGSAAAVKLDTRISSMAVSAFGVVLTGKLSATAPKPPIARLLGLPLPGRWRLLSALLSWAPGDHIVIVEFEFGDGTSERLTGADVALARPHEYPAGRWTARVIITDRRGRSDTTGSTLRVT